MTKKERADTQKKSKKYEEVTNKKKKKRAWNKQTRKAALVRDKNEKNDGRRRRQIIVRRFLLVEEEETRRRKVPRDLRFGANRFRSERGKIHLRIEEIETGKVTGHLRRRETFNESETRERGGETDAAAEEEVFAVFLRRVGRESGWF